MSRWFKGVNQVNFKFIRLKHQTRKAYLFEMQPGILIWIPKYKVHQLNKKSFIVSEPYSHEVNLKIYSELNSSV